MGKFTNFAFSNYAFAKKLPYIIKAIAIKENDILVLGCRDVNFVKYRFQVDTKDLVYSKKHLCIGECGLLSLFIINKDDIKNATSPVLRTRIYLLIPPRSKFPDLLDDKGYFLVDNSNYIPPWIRSENEAAGALTSNNVRLIHIENDTFPDSNIDFIVKPNTHDWSETIKEELRRIITETRKLRDNQGLPGITYENLILPKKFATYNSDPTFLKEAVFITSLMASKYDYPLSLSCLGYFISW